MILEKLQSTYMAGIERCYKERLKVDPKLRGKLVIGFGTDANGFVENSASVTGFDAEMDKCVTALAKTWRFPYAAGMLNVTLQLVPE